MHRRGSTRAKKTALSGSIGPRMFDPSGSPPFPWQRGSCSCPARARCQPTSMACGPGPSTRDGLDQVPPRPWNTWNIWNLQGSTPRRVKEETFTSWAQQAQEQGHKPPELVLNISLLERHRSSLCSMHSFNEPSKSQEVNLSIESPTRQQ